MANSKYTDISYKWNKKENRFDIECKTEQHYMGSLWTGGGTFGKLYPVDSHLVLTRLSFEPKKVFHDLTEFEEWVFTTYNIEANGIFS